MPHILEMPAFTIRPGVAKADFLCAHEKFNREFMSVQPGYLSHKLVKNDKQWFDIAVWESVEAKDKAFKDIYQNAAAVEYIALIDQEGTDDDIPLFAVVKHYPNGGADSGAASHI